MVSDGWKLSNRIGVPVCLLKPNGTPVGCPTSDVVNGNTVPMDRLSKECVFLTLSSIRGRLDWKASSWMAHALFTPTKDFDISADSSLVSLSRSSRL